MLIKKYLMQFIQKNYNKYMMILNQLIKILNKYK